MQHQPKNITLTYNEVVGYNCNNTAIYPFFQQTAIKEHYYSSNTSLYDPALARMLSPDNYVPAPHNPQAYNRYSYCLNNPLKYVDPEGNHPLLIAALIGASFGTYTGWKVGKAHGAKGEEMFGYILGGAIVGGVSGFGGAMIASGSFVMANTLSIAVGSFSYSSGMAGLSSKAIQPSISLGFGSYNFETGDFRSIFKWKNLNKQEKIGYSFGALANISDILAGFNPATFDYRAENAPVGWGDDRSKIDWVSHAQINDLAKNKPVIDWSGRLPVGQQNLARGTPLAIKDILFHKTIEISRVNAKTLYWWKDILEKTKYNVFFNNCAQAAARGLTISGVPVLKIHPWLLWGQLYARLIGIRPSLYSYYIMF